MLHCWLVSVPKCKKADVPYEKIHVVEKFRSGMSSSELNVDD